MLSAGRTGINTLPASPPWPPVPIPQFPSNSRLKKLPADPVNVGVKDIANLDPGGIVVSGIEMVGCPKLPFCVILLKKPTGVVVVRVAVPDAIGVYTPVVVIYAASTFKLHVPWITAVDEKLILHDAAGKIEGNPNEELAKT